MPTNRSQYNLREQLDTRHIINIIEGLNDDESFKNRANVLTATFDIVIAVHDSYYNDNNVQVLLETVIRTLRTRPVTYPDMQISKSALAVKPLIMQSLILMQDMVLKHQERRLQQKLLWLAISMHTAVLLMHHNKKTHTNNMLMQFKLAQFSESETRTWIWHELDETPRMNVDYIMASLKSVLEHLKIKLETNFKQAPLINPAISQISKIIAAYQDAHYLKRRITIKPNKNIKPINVAAEPNLQSSDSQHYFWDTPNDDVEHSVQDIHTQFYIPDTEDYAGLSTSFEETIDHYEAPFISYDDLTESLTKPSAPLQTIDLSLQQNHISQCDLALSSNTRVFPKTSYQALFSALSQDAQSSVITTDHICAKILLLCMITALPVKSLLTPGYIGHPRIFHIGVNRSYIEHHLGITKRSEAFDDSKHENKLDVIKIPIPRWLIDELLICDIPSKEDFHNYLANLRTTIGLPYLSLNRIETALHVMLSRYTPNSHTHIADLICRTPAPNAPAMYYSSHHSEEIFTHYKSALNLLNVANHFDLSYITVWHKYSVGSVFAFTPDYVHEVIIELRNWVDTSTDANMHFNRTSILVWFIFCLLTGVRPNNGIGKMSDIDLDVGWLMIDDKPVRKVKSHRLIPLCPTLLRYLIGYRNYMIDYQLNNLLKHEVSSSIDAIRLGDEVALLRLLSAHFDALTIIKRGDAYHMTKNIVDANPYWTRHFVRTQLERMDVDLVLINAVIGHEKPRQEALGRFSSLAKSQIKTVSLAFEQIASMLGLDDINLNGLQSYNEVSHANK